MRRPPQRIRGGRRTCVGSAASIRRTLTLPKCRVSRSRRSRLGPNNTLRIANEIARRKWEEEIQRGARAGSRSAARAPPELDADDEPSLSTPSRLQHDTQDAGARGARGGPQHSFHVYV